jgi:hypothetical protein
MSLETLRLIKILNSELLPNTDLPSEQHQHGKFWTLYSKSSLLGRSGLFCDYWVITKITSDSSSKYELYCGENVMFNKAEIKKIPDMIYFFENDNFKGIFIGETIIKLIKSGIYSWITNIEYTSSSGGSTSDVSGYIKVGDKLIGISPGTRMHHVDHSTGRVSEIAFKHAPIPNQLPGIVNISSFQRADTIAHAQQNQIMQLMNTPGVSLGSIGRNLGHIRFG